MNRRSILAAYKKKSSHFQTGVTGFKSGNLFNFVLVSVVSARGCGGRNVCGLCLLFSGAKAGKLGGLALSAPVFSALLSGFDS